MTDSIELLSETLIEQHGDLALEVLAASARLGQPLGWHYVLDLIWLLREIDLAPGATVLDAGAGWGISQFLLADRGLRVISADMSSRRPPARLQHLYNFEFMGDGAGIRHRYLERSKPKLKSNMAAVLGTPLGELPGKILRRLGLKGPARTQATPARAGCPTVALYHGALNALDELADASIDAVVSVSALEHNSPADITAILAEIKRVTKPDGALLLTVSATRDGERFHAPSHSFLLDESRLVATYALDNPRSNFSNYDAIAQELGAPRYLDRWLSWTYDDSLDNGMPGRVWAPAYLPVAIRKQNRLQTPAG